jgi:hypothetical protein
MSKSGKPKPAKLNGSSRDASETERKMGPELRLWRGLFEDW